jgi:hypothetical protein
LTSLATTIPSFKFPVLTRGMMFGPAPHKMQRKPDQYKVQRGAETFTV